MSRSATRPSIEETAVRDVYQQVMQAWNRSSGAELVGFDGTHLRGRKEIGPSTSGCSTGG